MSFIYYFGRITICALLVISVAACSDPNNNVVENSELANGESKPVLDVYKRATCGCCRKWVDHINEYGFSTNSHNKNDLTALKKEKGIAPVYQSCHTAVSKEGYVFEGHIPAKIIKRFLDEKPDGAIGLSVPRMPTGSPGMEVGNKFNKYNVLLLMKDGTAETYAEISSLSEQY